MMNMQNMMRQAQKLQKQMEQSQAELAATEFVGASAQNLVTATLTGDKKVTKIKASVTLDKKRKNGIRKSGTEIGHSLESDFVVPPPHS